MVTSETHFFSSLTETPTLIHTFSSPRLMHFTHGHVELHQRMPQGKCYSSDSHVVVVEYGNEKVPYSDLVSCLSGKLSSWTPTGSAHDVIIEPSDVFCFQLQRLVSQSGKYSPDPFVFPKSLYLDQFLLSNLELANKIRISERGMLDEISELSRVKEGLTRHNVRVDTPTIRNSNLQSEPRYY